MATLKSGSRGDEVKKLQQALNSSGYNLDEDGIYGSKTEAAVRDYQSKNGLSVDGIAGNLTQGKLYGTSTSTSGLPGVSSSTSQNLSKYEQGYKPSDTVQAALDKLNAAQQSKPEDYVSQWEGLIDSMWDQINNREDFAYDYSQDPTYNVYRDLYAAQGSQAMQDAMGQAAALSGGYGSSYAQSVGQQTYDQYLQDLNSIIPDLAEQAYARDQAEYADLMNRYQLAMESEAIDYDRYQDEVADYWTNLEYLTNIYNNELQMDYNQFADMLAYYQAKAAQEQEQANWDKEYNLALSQSRSSGSSGSSRSSRSSGSSGSSKTKDSSKPKQSAYYDTASKRALQIKSNIGTVDAVANYLASMVDNKKITLTESRAILGSMFTQADINSLDNHPEYYVR